MDEESVGVKLVLKLNEYKQKLKEALGLTKEATNSMSKSAKVKIDGIEEAKLEIMQLKKVLEDARWVLKQIEQGKIEGDWNTTAREVIGYEQALEEANNNLKKMQVNTDRIKSNSSSAFRSLGNDIKKATRRIGKYALTLLSLRSIYSLLSRAASAYLQQDTELYNKIQSAWVGLGAILSPIIEYLANLLTKIVSYINAFIYALTGIDYVAKANAKALANQTKETKKLANATMGIDELNIISKDESSSGGTTGTGTTGFTPEEVDETKVEKAVSISKKLWEDFKMGAGAFVVGFQGIIFVALGLIVGLFEGVWELIKGIGTGLWTAFSGIVNGIGIIFESIFEGLVIIVQGFVKGIKQIFEGFKNGDWKKVWEGLKTIAVGIFKGLWTAIKGIASGILTMLQGLIAGVVNIFIGAINGVITLMNGVLKGLNKIKIPDWVPVFGGNKVNFALIPKMSYWKPAPVKLATGAIANSRTLAEIGEEGKEGVVPLTNESAMRELGSIIGKYVQGGTSDQPTVITNVLKLDGNVIYKNQQKIARQKGASIMGGAFA